MNKFQQLKLAMQKKFKEREEVIEGALCALLSKKTMFVLGPPGTAKSALFEALCSSLEGNYFAHLMTKFTVPEEIYGPFSLSGLQQDKYVRNTSGKLPEADVAFLDEIFKSSSAIANTLLPIMNERVFFNDGRKPIPLQALFCASNEIPADAEQSPMYDRLILRYQVDRLKSAGSFRDILRNGMGDALPTLSRTELEQARQEVEKVSMEDSVIDMYLNLRTLINKEGIYVSDRRWFELVPVIKASAYLQGRDYVEVEDLVIVENCIWSTPEQIPQVRKLVRKLCNPLKDLLQNHIDAAHEAYATWEKTKGNVAKFVEISSKIQSSQKQLEELIAAHPERRGKILDAVEIVAELREKIKNSELPDQRVKSLKQIREEREATLLNGKTQE
jgi:MoxR-like ATPase